MTMRSLGIRLTVLACLIALLPACGSDDTTDLTGNSGPVEIPGWERVADPPLAPRSGASIVWTGEEILVVGGSAFLCPPGADCVDPEDPPFRDGAAFDPETGTWRSIADAPVPVPGLASTATMNGDVYGLAPTDQDGTGSPGLSLLRYRSKEDAWDIVEIPDATDVHGIVATDDAIVVYPTTDEFGDAPDQRFEKSDGSWATLPDDPLGPSFDRHYLWNHDGLHLFAKELTPSPGGEDGPSFVRGAVLDGDTWAELPTADSVSFWSAIVDNHRIVSPELGCVDGGEVNNYGRCISQGAVFDSQTRTWTPLPNEPHRGEKDVFGSGAVTSDSVLLTSLGHPMLDLVTDTWFTMPTIPDDYDDGAFVQRNFAGAGPYGFAFGGSVFGPDQPSGALLDDAWIWRPPDRYDGP